MTHATPHLDAELSAYLDDDLAPAARASVADHLERCEACAARLAELRSVLDRAAALEDREPETDLWPVIEARLSGASPRVFRLPRFDRTFRLTVPELAAAAALIALLSGAVAWFAAQGPKAPGAGTPFAGRATGTPATSLHAAAPWVATAGFESRKYDEAVAQLEDVLARNRGRLDPKTVHQVEANLATIDTAIVQARRALENDPANAYLNDHLADQLKWKVHVLQQAADAVTANYAGS